MFTVILCSEIRQQADREKGNDSAAARQHYSAFPGFIWQNLSSQLLLRWKLNSRRLTRTKSHPDYSGNAEWQKQLFGLWGGFNNFNLCPFGYCPGTNSPILNPGSKRHRAREAIKRSIFCWFTDSFSPVVSCPKYILVIRVGWCTVYPLTM